MPAPGKGPGSAGGIGGPGSQGGSGQGHAGGASGNGGGNNSSVGLSGDRPSPTNPRTSHGGQPSGGSGQADGLSIQTASGSKGGFDNHTELAGKKGGDAVAVAAAGGLTSPVSPVSGGSGSQGNNPIVSPPSIGGAYGGLPSPDGSADLLELLEQLLDAENIGGTDASGDLGKIGLSDTHSFPEFLQAPQGRILSAVVLLGVAIGGVYLWKKAA